MTMGHWCPISRATYLQPLDVVEVSACPGKQIKWGVAAPCLAGYCLNEILLSLLTTHLVTHVS